MAIKYQQRIHEAFAKEISDNPKEEMEKALKQFPSLKGRVSEIDFLNPDAAAIATSNAFICEHFALKSEEGEGLEFSKGFHYKSVQQTVRTNLAYYKNVLQFIQDEKEPDYISIYKAIKAKLESYFERAAEDILNDVYGEKYKQFFQEKSAEFAEKAKKNNPKKNEAADSE